MRQQEVAEWKASPVGRGEEVLEETNLEITEELADGVCRFTAKGHIDSNTADALLERLQKALADGHKTLILNMYNIRYLSSIGIRVILQIYKKTTEAGGKFNIEKPSEIVKNVLGMVALKEMLVTE
jgi:anti-sigma B factor antagonist